MVVPGIGVQHLKLAVFEANVQQQGGRQQQAAEGGASSRQAQRGAAAGQQRWQQQEVVLRVAARFSLLGDVTFSGHRLCSARDAAGAAEVVVLEVRNSAASGVCTADTCYGC